MRQALNGAFTRAMSVWMAAGVAATVMPAAAQNLIVNPGFDDVDLLGGFGDSWASFGAAGFDNFIPNGNPGHAVLFGDQLGNAGGVFQPGIAAVGGLEYTFDVEMNYEANWDAAAQMSLEFYAADDATLLGGRTVTLFNRPEQGYDRVALAALAPAGSAFVRPVVRFSGVGSSGIARAATADNASLTAADENVNRLANGAFLDLNGDFTPGDGWFSYGAAGLNDFFGAGNPGHGTLFADFVSNNGGIFQLRRAGRPGEVYEFSAAIQFESNWDARAEMVLEFWGADDGQFPFAGKLGEAVLTLPNSARGLGYRRYTLTATAATGTVYVRPVVRFDQVQSNGSSRAATIDNALLVVADDNLINNPGFLDQFGSGEFGSQWASFGNAGFDNFFPNGDAGHGSLFADQVVNAGGIFQQGIAATPGEGYTLTVAVSTEASFDADLTVGLEFYSADDATLLNETVTRVTPTGGAGYAEVEVAAVAPAGSAFVRPVVKFSNVRTEGPGRAATVDTARLVAGPVSLCRADIDGDGDADIFDIFAFFNAFGAGQPVADFTGDGVLNIFDIFGYFTAFASPDCG